VVSLGSRAGPEKTEIPSLRLKNGSAQDDQIAVGSGCAYVLNYGIDGFERRRVPRPAFAGVRMTCPRRRLP
jgi:hypothetical protein